MGANESPDLDRANLGRGVLAGAVTAIVFGLGGFFLVYREVGYMGWTLFLLVPVATGFATRW